MLRPLLCEVISVSSSSGLSSRDVFALQVDDWKRAADKEQGCFITMQAAEAVRQPPATETALHKATTKLASSSSSTGGSRSPTQERARVVAMVLEVVRELVVAPQVALTSETPLMEAGVDSLAATELSSLLRARTGVSLSPTIAFEQPTAGAIATHVLELLGGVSNEAVSSALMTSGTDTQLLAVGQVGRWPGGCNGEVSRRTLQAACGDAVGSVPLMRWVLEEAVDVSVLSAATVKCVAHGGFVWAVENFDASAFHISLAEAAAMDPQQRLLLELGYAALHSSSHQRATLMGGDSGVFLGIERPDWALVLPPSARASVYAFTGSGTAAASGRLSFALGLQGPCSSIDAACASALTAFHGACSAARRGESSAALAIAISLKLSPHGGVALAGAGFISATGRCKTWDVSATGMVRSEGVGGFVLCPGENALEVNSSAVRQDGRSASLTAPNGSAQRTLLLLATRSVAAAAEIGQIEAHGTGTALGDPTEAGAIVAVHCTVDRELPLVVMGVKASLGHSEGVSGQVGLLRLRQVVKGSATPGNAQLRALNLLVRARLGPRAAKFVLPVQSAASRMACGVSSFGYSGTIAHGVLRDFNADVRHPSPHLPCTYSYQRCAFLWNDLVHPFAHCRVPLSPEGTAIFRSRAANDYFHNSVRHHVIESTVIFPGAGYLEMARAAAAAAAASTSRLSGIFFLQPLKLEVLHLHVHCSITNGHFDVQAGALAPGAVAFAEAAVHCSGTLVAHDALHSYDPASVRVRLCAHAAHVDALYDGFDTVGVQYGPGYRSLAQAWSGGSSAAARLQARRTHEGTQVHPADLDDALCVSTLITASGGGGPRLPFAVDDAQLQEAPAELRTVRPFIEPAAHAPPLIVPTFSAAACRPPPVKEWTRFVFASARLPARRKRSWTASSRACCGQKRRLHRATCMQPSGTHWMRIQLRM